MGKESEAEAGTSAVARLIEKATDSTAGEVDPRLLRAIKSTVRSSDDEIHAAVDSLMEHMKKQHAQVRFLAVLIVDELFMRSKLFRSLLVVNFDQFLSLSIGFRRDLPLPPPSSIASNLRSKSVELLEKWNASFGIYYRQLRMGFNYLKNTLRYQFPNRLENAARLQQERQEREMRSKQILLSKLENLKENFSSIKAEIQSTIDEIEECLEILNVKREEFTPNMSTEDDEVEEFKSLTLQQIRLESLKEGEKVKENSDNKAIFDALRESLKLLISKHLSAVQEWISVLVRVDLTDNKFRDTALKEFIDIRNLIHSVRERCGQLGCVLDDRSNHKKDEDDDDLWEEGKVEHYMPATSSIPNSSVGNSADTATTSKGKDVAPPDANDSSVGHGLSSTSERSRLLVEAPVVTWGPFLDNWGSNKDALANQRGLELQGHWGRVDYDAVIPAEKIAELNFHRTVYKEELVEIQPCRAPLKKGGLCRRRDLRVCPFHGPIVPRDDEGNPIEQNSQSERETEKEYPAMSTDLRGDSADASGTLNLGKEMVEKLGRQAVKNVRERERDMKSMKRAKRAKIREHNEDVLREAAIASTSYSEAFAEHTATSAQNGAEVNVKKPTLASMLKKKITAKDRLAQRLLNSHVTDSASRQLMQGEDSKYREAFPNQW
ncbi:UV-stimulated scaffold protein A homolog [Phoenix dactylifera]|uniref:UV-stimulated scaffold protein A homolog n=1 Tax=Phoenix dactylifera TaxID=42345 RepID=A0A8B7BQD4_PHODC|nr:UV-stimulated scaffold protein A homolog [Phoenix dactylifera]